MKKCEFCAEEIQDEAVKCKHCGEFLNKKQPEKWYAKISVLVVAFLVVGPLALPLVWINKGLSRNKKIFITVIMLVISYYLWVVMADSLKNLSSYYEMMGSF